MVEMVAQVVARQHQAAEVLEPEPNHLNQALAALMALETMEQNLHLEIGEEGEAGQAAPLQEVLTVTEELESQALFLERALLMQVVAVAVRMEVVLQREPAVARLVVMV
jgi:hypothetical protein